MPVEFLTNILLRPPPDTYALPSIKFIPSLYPAQMFSPILPEIEKDYTEWRWHFSNVSGALA